MKKLGIIGVLAAGVVFAGCSTNQTTGTSTSSSAAATSLSQETASSSQTTGSQTTNSSASGGTTVKSDIQVTADEALAKYQEAYPNTSITSLDLDTSFGSYYYDVKGVDDNVEYEATINAQTGELNKEREEKLDTEDQNGVERQNEALDTAGILTIDEAADVALQSVGSGEAIEWSLERELSITYWEVIVKDGMTETSVKFDAKTGELLETEIDD